jgi:hypothetical protein
MGGFRGGYGSLIDDQQDDPWNYHEGATSTPPPAPPPLGAPLNAPVNGNNQLSAASGSGGGNGGGGGSAPDYSFPDLGPLPVFEGGPAFVAPDLNSVLNSPDYQSRLQSGTNALERSAAARGTLRTGGTLKDIIDYGKKFGQGEYDTSFNHAVQGYQLNYQRLHDKFAPQMAGYQAALARALAIYGRGTQWNAPHYGGGGGYSGIPPFMENPYGDPGGSVPGIPSLTPTGDPEGNQQQIASELWPEAY